MFKSTVDDVISNITKQVGQLRHLAAEHFNNHLIHLNEGLRHNELSLEQCEKQNRANRIADKLDELLK